MKNIFFLAFSVLCVVLLFIVAGCPEPDTKQKKNAPAITSNSLTISASKMFIREGEYEKKGYISLTFEQGARLKAIEKNAFKGNLIATLELPESVQTIREGAFEDNPIEKLTLPASLITIEKNAFKGHNLVEVVLHSKIKHLEKNAFANKDGDKKPLPTFKVYSYSVMALVASQFTTTDDAGNIVPPLIETVDESLLETETIVEYTTNIKNGKKQPPPRITSAPTIESIPNNGHTYARGEVIRVVVTFNEMVWVTGTHPPYSTPMNTPYITLKIGDEQRQAIYDRDLSSKVSPPNTGKKLIFTYTVVKGDEDEDGIEIGENAFASSKDTSAAIKDTAGNGANLGHDALHVQAQHKVDTKAPVIPSAPTIESIPKKDGTYNKVEVVIRVAVMFDEEVQVTGKPEITLRIGDKDRQATYDKGLSSSVLSSEKGKKLIFTYTVVEGDEDEDGIEIGANTLTRPGGATIKNIEGNDANLGHDALAPQVQHKVDPKAPVIPSAPTIESTPLKNNIYTKGEVIRIAVMFDEEVQVTGKPEITLKIGDKDRQATYDKGLSSSVLSSEKGKKLIFTYTVVEGDEDEDGIEIGANTLTRPGGATIKDIEGNDANLGHDALAPQVQHKVDTKAPTIESTLLKNNIYTKGEVIRVAVMFDEEVQVTGKPEITLKIGDKDRQAIYDRDLSSKVSPPNTGKKLIFTYTVVDGDNDEDGIEIGVNTLTLPDGASIKDTAGNDANLGHDALAPQVQHKVDTKVPTISSAPTILSFSNIVITVAVDFDEVVQVTGKPEITLRIGDKDRQATYDKDLSSKVSPPDTEKKLIFTYTVVEGDEDEDGIEIGANTLTRSGDATIRDTGGNDANLGHDALTAQENHKVYAKDIVTGFKNPGGIAITSDDTILYVADSDNGIIKKIVFSTGKVTSIARGFKNPGGIAITSDDKILYVVDSGNGIIKKIVLSTGKVTTVAKDFKDPAGIAITSDNEMLYITDAKHPYEYYIKRIIISTGKVSTIAGKSQHIDIFWSPDKYLPFKDGKGTDAVFNNPRGIAITSDDKVLYVADSENHSIRKIILSTSDVSSLVKGFNEKDMKAKTIVSDPYYWDPKPIHGRPNMPKGIAVSPKGTIFFADTNNHLIKTITPDGKTRTFAGNTGDTTIFNTPRSIVFSSDGTILYVADSGNNRIRKVKIQ